MKPGMKVGLIEPHLRRFGGIRRVVEFANRLVARGHSITFYLPDDQVLSCTWMRCDATVKTITSGFGDDLDVLVFNHEPQWHLLDRFTNARRRIFYALHYSRCYDKEGSWESIRTPVDLQLANSSWTADQIEAEIGYRPRVLLGGANRDVFRPYGGAKRYPLLSVGDARREWKGHETILEAGRLLGVPVEEYAPKNLSQADLGREYDAARVFAVGSWFEGFCQPGLEAMACGVPLVTTDNGGCREYARDRETALVVAPRDPVAMANAIRRLLDDEALAKELVANGLDVVERDFDWEKRTDEFAEILDGVVSGAAAAPSPRRPDPPTDPLLSIVTIAADNLEHTQDFVESVRHHTDVPYELVIVDNASAWEAANYSSAAADRAVMNSDDDGFARGMNEGLAVSHAPYVAFCTSETILPPGWASTLVETARAHPNAGLVIPALVARNDKSGDDGTGDDVEVLPPFSAPPGALVYVMPRDVVEGVGAWDEGFELASGEDVDLAFKVWVNDRDVVHDRRVLVDHVRKGGASRADDWQGRWARSRQHFLDKWAGQSSVPRLPTCDPDRFARNRAVASSVAEWMAQYFRARDRPATMKQALKQAPRPSRSRSDPSAGGYRERARREMGRNLRRVKRRTPPAVMRQVRTVLVYLPPSVEERVRSVARR
jgi:GT2 family glycosyltransferase